MKTELCWCVDAVLQLLSRPAGMEPGALKRMDLAGDGYHMTVSVIDSASCVSGWHLRRVATTACHS